MSNTSPDGGTGRGSESARQWRLRWAGRIGEAVQHYRKKNGLTAVALSKRTAKLGYPMTRLTITLIETNKRGGKLDLAELAVLAAALRVPPIMLAFPELPDGLSEPLPDVNTRAMQAFRWFIGHGSFDRLTRDVVPDDLEEDRELRNARELYSLMFYETLAEDISAPREANEGIIQGLADTRARLRAAGMTVKEDGNA